MEGRLVAFWTSRESLKTKTIKSLMKIMAEVPADGWVKGGKQGTRPCVVTMDITGYDKMDTVVEYVQAGDIVVLNVEAVEWAVAKRIIDFLSGTLMGLGGSIQKVGNHVFLIVPHGIESRGFPDWNEIQE